MNNYRLGEFIREAVHDVPAIPMGRSYAPLGERLQEIMQEKGYYIVTKVELMTKVPAAMEEARTRLLVGANSTTGYLYTLDVDTITRVLAEMATELIQELLREE